MPDPPLTMTRRTALGVLAGCATATLADLVLAGCKHAGGTGVPSPTSPAGRTAGAAIGSAAPTSAAASANADIATAARAAAAERALVSLYDTAIDAHPQLRDRLVAQRADHVAHLHGLAPTMSPPALPPAATAAEPSSAPGSGAAESASESPSLSPMPSGAPAPTPTAVQVFAQLAAAEKDAAAARLGDVAASSGTLAALLASIGGCEAAHAALLTTWTVP